MPFLVTKPSCTLCTTWVKPGQAAALPYKGFRAGRSYGDRGRWHQLSKTLREGGAAAAKPVPWDSRDTTAAVLVTGTAIGGGFLALPYTTAPAGFVPSLVVMLLSWGLLFVQAQVATDLIVEESSTSEAVSFAVMAERRLGKKGKAVVSALFLLLMMTTLVSQYAEAGTLFSSVTGVDSQPLIRGLLALFLFALTWKSPTTRTAAINGLLTLGFVLASLLVFGSGLPLAQWPRLQRSDWWNCAKSFPSIMQLFVYLEVTPSIASILQLKRGRIKRAIFVGSALLFVLEATWSALGLALVPFHGASLREDPVAVLLGQTGPISSAVRALGCFAVLTTILGTNLALRSFCGNAKWLAAAASLAPALAPQGAFFAAIDFAGAYPVTLLWGCALPLMALAGPRKSGRRQVVLLLSLLLLSVALVVSYAISDLGRGARWL